MKDDQQCQGTAKVKPNSKFWGMIDTKGDYILDPDCYSIHDWREGISLIEKIPSNIEPGPKWSEQCDGSYGFIRSDGHLITDFSYGYANDFSNGLAAVNKHKKWGFIDTHGQLVIPLQFDGVWSFQPDGCVVFLDGRYGLIDRDGAWKIENQFHALSDFAFGYGIATLKSGILFKREHRILIDVNGKKIIDLPKQWTWFKPVSDNLMVVGTISNYPGIRMYGFMNFQGEIITPPQFNTDSDSLFDTNKWSEGLLAVRDKNGLTGFVNEQGVLVIPPRFQSVTPFIDGIAKATANDETFFIDKSGTPVHYTEPEPIHRPFDEVLDFSEGLAVARRGDRWGVIDENNKIVIDFKYADFPEKDSGSQSISSRFSCGLIGIREERDTTYAGYLDRTGNIAIELKFNVAESFYPNTVPPNPPAQP